MRCWVEERASSRTFTIRHKDCLNLRSRQRSCRHLFRPGLRDRGFIKVAIQGHGTMTMGAFWAVIRSERGSYLVEDRSLPVQGLRTVGWPLPCRHTFLWPEQVRHSTGREAAAIGSTIVYSFYYTSRSGILG